MVTRPRMWQQDQAVEAHLSHHFLVLIPNLYTLYSFDDQISKLMEGGGATTIQIAHYALGSYKPYKCMSS